MKFDFLKKSLVFLFCYFYGLAAVLAPSEAYAIYEGVRNVGGYASHGKCKTGFLSPDPFVSNKDITWEMNNPTCIGYVAIAGAAKVTAGIVTKLNCTYFAKNMYAKGLTTYEAAEDGDVDLPALNPADLKKTITRSKLCAKRTAESAAFSAMSAANCGVPVPTPPTVAACSLATAQAPLAAADASACCSTFATYMLAFAAAVAALMAIYTPAAVAYDQARICGEGWTKWTNIGGDKWIKGKGDYAKCLEQTFYGVEAEGINCGQYRINPAKDIRNQNYREFIYGGFEYEDEQIKNPAWYPKDQRKYLGYDSKYMRFYMTGAGNTPVYACHRFLRLPRNPQSLRAYEDCKRRSQDAVCIEMSDSRLGTDIVSLGTNSLSREVFKSGMDRTDYEFCSRGSKCWVKGIQFEAYESKIQPNYMCAKTYSVCPYNHQLGGGTEIKEMMSGEDSMYVKNFCQYMNHCSKIPVIPYIRTSSLEGGFISSACRDLRGDSQNIYSYQAEAITPIATRGFSAPMAQCFKETLENVLLNSAGYTKCVNADEFPDENGECESGYIYRKGFDLDQQSFLSKIREKLQGAIKMMLVLSVIAFGFMILMAVPNAAIEKKKLFPYILKIGLVMYFAAGDEWHEPFLKGILGTSTFLSELVFDVDVAKDELDDEGRIILDKEDQRDGCQFPRFNYAASGDQDKYVNPQYPEGKEYLAIWDTLDCKIARALGFGPDVSVPNIVLMIVAGFFTGGLGILFVIASFLFAFFLISVTVRALHIFLVSVIVVVIMIYVSPITITMSLFERTKGIFDNWKKQLMGYILQPMILFAYLGLLIAIFDRVIIGEDVRFAGDGKTGMKSIVCTDKAEETSMYCIFRVNNIKTWRGLEIIGIGIPILTDMTPAKFNSIIKAAILMFIFANFMDKITYFAKKLVGGEEISNGWNISTAKIASKAQSISRGVQKRAIGAASKHTPKILKGIGRKAQAGIRMATSKGKGIENVEAIKGATNVGEGQDGNRGGPTA